MEIPSHPQTNPLNPQTNPLNMGMGMGTLPQTNPSNPPPQTNPLKLFYIDKDKITEGTTIVYYYLDDDLKNNITQGTVTGTPILGFGSYEIDNLHKVKNLYTYDFELSNGKQVVAGGGGRRRKSKKVFKNMNKNKNKKRKSRKSRKSRKYSTRSRRY